MWEVTFHVNVTCIVCIRSGNAIESWFSSALDKLCVCGQALGLAYQQLGMLTAALKVSSVHLLSQKYLHGYLTVGFGYFRRTVEFSQPMVIARCMHFSKVEIFF